MIRAGKKTHNREGLISSLVYPADWIPTLNLTMRAANRLMKVGESLSVEIEVNRKTTIAISKT